MTTDAPAGPVTIHEGYFETGWDGWIDGGSDCARTTNASHAYEGSASIRIRDNSGNASTMTSPTFDLSGYSNVEFNFYFKSVGMENGENFIVSYDNGSGWVILGDYARGTDFNNGPFYNISLNLSDVAYNFTVNSRFKIQCDASANNDKIFIDQVVVTGTGGSAARILNTELQDEALLVLEEEKGEEQTTTLSTEVDKVTYDVVISEEISIYPNPTIDMLNIKNSKSISNLQIFDISGKRVFASNVNLSVIDVSDFEKGMYNMIIRTQEGELITKKFVKM